MSENAAIASKIWSRIQDYVSDFEVIYMQELIRGQVDITCKPSAYAAIVYIIKRKKCCCPHITKI